MATLKTVIQTHQRGLLYRDGQLVSWLEPGAHSFWTWRAEQRVDVLDLSSGYIESTPELRDIIPADAGYEVTIAPYELAVVTQNGVPTGGLGPGRYILWQLRATVEVVVYDTRELTAEIPDDHVSKLPAQALETYHIATSQRGALYVDKRPALWLEPGVHRIFKRNRVLNLYYINVADDTYVIDAMPELLEIVPKGASEPLEVGNGEYALVYRDGRVIRCLESGSYLMWKVHHRITARVFSSEELFSEVPEKDWSFVPAHIMNVRVVRSYERGLLWVDGAFHGVLGEGRYALNIQHRAVDFQVTDMREQELQIQGQEVMTSDKVTLRLNLVVKYRIIDARKSIESSTNLAGALYSESQLVARAHVAATGVDALLEQRHGAGDMMHQELAPRAEQWGVEILRVDIKDVILPGEMKTLLNRVIEAEKQAAANVIMRREETAATRAQANTAKMMENNPALMRLRELEMMREIATNVGNITVVAGGDQVVRWARGEGS